MLIHLASSMERTATSVSSPRPVTVQPPLIGQCEGAAHLPLDLSLES